MKRTVWKAIWSSGWLAALALSGCGGGGGLIGSADTRAAQQPGGGASGGGAGGAVNELLVGGRVKSLTGSGSSLTAFVLEPRPAPGQSTKPADATISVTKDTTYQAGEKRLTAADLKVGLPVEVTLTAKLDANKGTAKAVKVLPPMVAGKVKSRAPASGALTSLAVTPQAPPGQTQPADVTISVTSSTKYLAGDKAATADDVKAGLAVEVGLTAPIADNKGTAAVVRILPPPLAAGKIKSLSPASGTPTALVLQAPPAPQGQTGKPDLSLTLTSATKILAGDKALTAADLKVGLAVEALLAAAPVDNKATAVEVKILPFKAVGTVKSVKTANSALASFVVQAPTAPSGQTTPPDLTISVTANTKYAKDGAAATSAEVKAGVKIEAFLTGAPVNNAGTASGVNVVTKPAR